jgi:hypothetical protein
VGFKEKIYLCVRKTHKHTLNRKKRSAEVRKRRCHGKGKMYERELNKNEQRMRTHKDYCRKKLPVWRSTPNGRVE